MTRFDSRLRQSLSAGCLATAWLTGDHRFVDVAFAIDDHTVDWISRRDGTRSTSSSDLVHGDFLFLVIANSVRSFRRRPRSA